MQNDKQHQKQASVGVPRLVNEASCRQEETVVMVRDFGPDASQPPARGESLIEQKLYPSIFRLNSNTHE